jgi:hypothetical protein
MNESCEGSSPNWRWHPDTMSRECRYDKQREDERCDGCTRVNALGEGRERGILREASSGEAATSTDELAGKREG